MRQDNPARLVATAPTLRTPMHHAGLHKFKGYSALEKNTIIISLFELLTTSACIAMVFVRIEKHTRLNYEFRNIRKYLEMVRMHHEQSTIK